MKKRVRSAGLLAVVVPREELAEAIWAARRHLPDSNGELSAELNACAIATSLNQDEILRIVQYAETRLQRAMGAMAYRIATSGLPMVKEE